MKLGKFEIEFHHNKNECKTTCIVQNRFNGLVSTGEVTCGKNDNFEKKIGRKISLTRAIETLPRENRILIWEDYKHVTNFYD